jgi:hypothetical protein
VILCRFGGGEDADVTRTSSVVAVIPVALFSVTLVALVSAGISKADILTKIASSKCQFDTSIDAITQLSRAGATPAIRRPFEAGKGNAAARYRCGRRIDKRILVDALRKSRRSHELR